MIKENDKKYKIKNNGNYVYDKMTCRNIHDNKIKYISWKSAVEVDENTASVFTEDEVKYMKETYGRLKIIEIK